MRTISHHLSVLGAQIDRQIILRPLLYARHLSWLDIAFFVLLSLVLFCCCVSMSACSSSRRTIDKDVNLSFSSNGDSTARREVRGVSIATNFDNELFAAVMPYLPISVSEARPSTATKVRKSPNLPPDIKFLVMDSEQQSDSTSYKSGADLKTRTQAITKTRTKGADQLEMIGWLFVLILSSLLSAFAAWKLRKP